jgi:hypothetical protein
VFTLSSDNPLETEFDMKKQYLISATTVLLAVGGMTLAQQQQRVHPTPLPPPSVPIPTTPGPNTIPPSDPLVQAPVPQSYPQPTPPVPVQIQYSVPLAQPTAPVAPQRVSSVVAPSKMEDMTIDQLLDAVESLRDQKAELEKKEQAMLKLIEKKADKQNERIDRLKGEAPMNRAIYHGQPVIGVGAGGSTMSGTLIGSSAN